jgi:hypothetical protein
MREMHKLHAFNFLDPPSWKRNSNGVYSNVHLFLKFALTQTGYFYSHLHRKSASLTSARTWKMLRKHTSEQNTSETACYGDTVPKILECIYS